jgi:hypothetical protein
MDSVPLWDVDSSSAPDSDDTDDFNDENAPNRVLGITSAARCAFLIDAAVDGNLELVRILVSRGASNQALHAAWAAAKLVRMRPTSRFLENIIFENAAKRVRLMR